MDKYSYAMPALSIGGFRKWHDTVWYRPVTFEKHVDANVLWPFAMHNS